MSDGQTRRGQCFCGTVRVTVTGAPVAMGICHCDSCRAWPAGPASAFTLWKPYAAKITRDAEKVGSYQKTQNSIRKWCTECGGHLLTEHPLLEVTDVYAALIPDLAFKPMAHVNYENTVLPMRDGLPKQNNFSAGIGGAGVLLGE